MKQIINSIFFSLLIIQNIFILAESCPVQNNCTGISSCDTKCCDGPKTYFRIRSQGANTFRELVGWQDLIYLPQNRLFQSCDRIEGAYATTFEYQRSFRPKNIARYLFGSNCLSFKGSAVSGRDNNKDILADYFGLSRDFNGKLFIDPVIDNFILDNQLYIGLDNWSPGLFFKLNAPIVHTRWDLGLKDCSENVNNPPTGFDPGYMGVNDYNEKDNALAEKVPALKSLREGLSGQTFGEMSTPWNFGKFPFCRKELTRIADIDLMLGFNFINNDCLRFGAYAITVVPTGNVPDPRQIFSPVVGNGRHWELGVGITGAISLGSFCCNNIAIYYEGNLTHLFSSDQVRSFDFNNGQLSRYMLLKQIGRLVLLNNNTGNLVIEPKLPAIEAEQFLYSGNLINAINFATRNTEVKIGLKGDFSIKLALSDGPYTFDLGYNIYGHTREELCIKCQPPCCVDERKYSFKGTTGTEFFANQDGNTFGSTNTNIVTLNASQSNSTIFNGTVNPANVDKGQKLLVENNAQIPNAGFEFLFPTPPDTNSYGVYTLQSTNDIPEIGINWNNNLSVGDNVNSSALNSANEIAYISQEPVLISVKDLNICSATAPAQLTHKVFTHINYVWDDSRFTPFIGIGGEVEFGSCNGLSQWGLLFKGGITF